MPNFVDAFPHNYGVTNSPLDRLSIDPMQFIDGVATPFGGTAADPIGNPLALATTGLNGFIDMANQVISSVIPGAGLLPDITQLVQLLGPCLAPTGLLSGFFQGIPFVNLLFGGLTGTGPGSGTGLFGTSSLFNAGGLFGGLLGNVPILGQLIGAAGGNANAPNLLDEFVSIFSGGGGGGLSFANLISLFTNAIPGLSGSAGLGSIFTDILGLLGNPTSLGGGSPAIPGVNSIPLLGGLFGSSGLLSGFTSGIPIVSQLISMFGGAIPGLSGIGGLTSIFSDVVGLLGSPTSLGGGSPTLPGVGSIPLLGGLFGSSGLLGGFTSGIPILSQLIGMFGGGAIPGLSGLGGLTSIFTDLMGLLGGPTQMGSGNPILGSLSSIPLLGPLQQLIDGVSGGASNPLSTLVNDLLYGIGSIDPARITHVPISAIGNGIGATTGATPNLILNPTFDGSTSVIAGDPNWQYDGTHDHTGATGSGSAKVTANGTPLTLLSNPMAVSAGQQFSFSGWTQWSGLTSTGSPITLGLQTYDAVGNPVSSPVLASVSSPGAAGGWQQLSATWTVPSGVQTVRVALNVGASATAGNVWFDDLSATKTGLMSGSWMTGINGTVAQDLQQIPDMLFNFLNGGSSSGNPLGSITNVLQGLLGGFGPAVIDLGNGTGTPTIPGIVDNGNGTASYGSILGTNPLAGTLFDMGNGTALTPMHLIQNLGGIVGSVMGLATSLQQVIDGIGNATSAAGITGSNPGDVFGFLSAIPFANVQGVQGILDIGTTVQHTWDQLMSAATQGSASDTLLTELAGAIQGNFLTGTNALNQTQVNSNTLGIRTNRPIGNALEATSQAPFNLSLANTMTATATVAPMSFHIVGQDASLGLFQVLAQNSGTITGLVFNVYKMDSSVNLNKVFTTSDLHSQLGGATWTWLTQTIVTANQIPVVAGDVIAVEPIVTGSGTLTLPANNITAVPAHPTAKPKHFAASRNPTTLGSSPTQIAAASVVYGGNAPWWSMGIVNLPAGYEPPVTTQYSTPGTFTYSIPSWAAVAGAKLDLVVLGGGGGGQANYGALVDFTGGNSGSWSDITLTCGVDYPVGATSVTVVVGAHGLSAGAYWNNGNPGSASTATWNDGSTNHTITGSGGAGGGNTGTSGSSGKSPGNVNFAGKTYFGGSAVGANQTGSFPGGGGGGAGPYQVGADGADGSVWITARQS